METPQIDVVRGLPGLELRANGDDGPMPSLFGHFSRFNEWYEINSWMEGDFLERFAPGAFAESFRLHWDESDPHHHTKVQFQHGFDPSVGQRLLGKLSELREDDVGGFYEAPLFDTQYNRELVPGLEAGEYGASFRFRVTSESWVMEPGVSDYNPHALPERTITGALVPEVGPVAFGASPTATAGARSLTDDYYEAVRAKQPQVFEEACRAFGRQVPDDPSIQRRRNGGRWRRGSRTELKALPDAVLSRKRGIDLETITTRRRGQELIEARRTTPETLKAEQVDDKVVVEGYVITYDKPRQVADEKGWTEVWSPGACADSVGRSPDVRLTLNGEGEPVARSKAGTLDLISDDYGVHIRATIDPSTPRGEDVALAVQRNERVDVQVGFDVTRQRWTDDHDHRTVQDANLRDMAFCIDGWDARSGEDLSRLHTDPEPDPDDDGMSLELMRMINDTFEI